MRTEMTAPRIEQINWTSMQIRMYQLSAFEFLERLTTAVELFIMILVSWPVYTATPMTHSVSRRVHPLRRKPSFETGNFVLL